MTAHWNWSGLRRHAWSAASISVTVVGLLVTFLTVIYFLGQGGLVHGSRADRVLGLINAGALCSSFVTAVVALAKERKPWYSLLALALSVLSLLFYVR